MVRAGRYVNVTVRRDLYERLREEASRRGMSVPDFIRHLLLVYCDLLAGAPSRALGVNPGTVQEASRTNPGAVQEQSRNDPGTVQEASRNGGGARRRGGAFSWVVERVRRRKVVLLSELRLRSDPARAMEEVERAGHVVLSGAKDLALVDGRFWEEFKARLPQLPRDPVLEGAEGKLFSFLKENALIVYGPGEGWRLA